MKLFIGNIAWEVSAAELRNALAEFNPENVCLIVDRATGRSRGYAFVEFASAELAEKARGAIDGLEIRGRAIRVAPAHERRT